MPHVGFADVGHKKERKGIMLFGKFQIYMPDAGFVGVRHRCFFIFSQIYLTTVPDYARI